MTEEIGNLIVWSLAFVFTLGGILVPTQLFIEGVRGKVRDEEVLVRTGILLISLVIFLFVLDKFLMSLAAL